jgi:hypothetical protein
MYVLMIALLMGVLPLTSIAMEAGLRPDLAVVGKWFVFWMVGVRLFAAGARQFMQPRYTTETVLGIPGEANLALGCGGIATPAVPSWTPSSYCSASSSGPFVSEATACASPI